MREIPYRTNNDEQVMKILSGEKLCPTKILAQKVCMFRLFYWTKVMKFVKVAEIMSDIILSNKLNKNAGSFTCNNRKLYK